VLDKDIDLVKDLITVIGAKGNKDLNTVLAKNIKAELIDHIKREGAKGLPFVKI
jgi:hypothetical protein